MGGGEVLRDEVIDILHEFFPDFVVECDECDYVVGCVIYVGSNTWLGTSFRFLGFVFLYDHWDDFECVYDLSDPGFDLEFLVCDVLNCVEGGFSDFHELDRLCPVPYILVR